MKRQYQGRFKQRRGYTKSTLPRQVAWLTRQQKITMGKELADRNYVTYGQNATVDGTGTIIHVTNISTGTGLASRKDLKIKLSKLEYRYIATAADTVNTIRVLIVQAKNQSTGSPSDYFRSSSGGTSLGYSEQANVENCYILADHLLHAGSEQASCTGSVSRFPIKTLTFPNTNAIGVTAGAIYVCLFSDSQAASHPSVTGFCKLKYYD